MKHPTVARHCPGCKHYVEISLPEQPKDLVLTCPHCQKEWGKVTDMTQIFEFCPVCQCRQFYTGKDFNQFLGCLIMLPGIVLVPWTYGLSLPVFAFVDWLFYRKVPSLIACYRCGTEFRHFMTDKPFKPFMHHIGLKYDKYR